MFCCSHWRCFATLAPLWIIFRHKQERPEPCCSNQKTSLVSPPAACMHWHQKATRKISQFWVLCPSKSSKFVTFATCLKKNRIRKSGKGKFAKTVSFCVTMCELYLHATQCLPWQSSKEGHRAPESINNTFSKGGGSVEKPGVVLHEKCRVGDKILCTDMQNVFRIDKFPWSLSFVIISSRTNESSIHLTSCRTNQGIRKSLLTKKRADAFNSLVAKWRCRNCARFHPTQNIASIIKLNSKNNLSLISFWRFTWNRVASLVSSIREVVTQSIELIRSKVWNLYCRHSHLVSSRSGPKIWSQICTKWGFWKPV